MRSVGSSFRLRVSVLLFCCVAFATHAAANTTHTFFPVADTFVYAEQADTNFGTADGFATGTAPTTPAHHYYAYLRFDLTSLPADQEIVSAKLFLYQFLGGGFTGAPTSA